MTPTSAMILTSPNPGAIGVIRVVGSDAIAAVSATFKPNQGPRLHAKDCGKPRFGRMSNGAGDEVVALVTSTSPTTVEIHGHGGQAALRSILEELAGMGVRIESVQPSSELERLLSRATTLRVASILADQLDGAFERERSRLIHLMERSPAEAAAQAARLLELAPIGQRLERGWRVVLVGRPNVGKSMLLNAIAGFGRSIVSPIAGTTRDVVTVRVAIDGWPVEISDTAGVRAEATGVEAAGMALGAEHRASCDLEVVVLDRSRELAEEDRDLVNSSPGGLIIANKTDLAAAWDERRPGPSMSSASIPAVSAATGEGLGALLTAIAERLVPSPPVAGAVVPILAEQAQWLDSLVARLAATSD